MSNTLYIGILRTDFSTLFQTLNADSNTHFIAFCILLCTKVKKQALGVLEENPVFGYLGLGAHAILTFFHSINSFCINNFSKIFNNLYFSLFLISSQHLKVPDISIRQLSLVTTRFLLSVVSFATTESGYDVSKTCITNGSAYPR